MPFESTVKLKIANNASALQEHVLLPWLREQLNHLSVSPLPSVVLVPRQAVGVALKRMALDAGIALFNVHVLTPGQLRTRLSKEAGLEEPIAVREDLRLLMRYAAGQMVTEHTQAELIADSPDQLLSAWDRYAAAGYSATALEGELYVKIVNAAELLIHKAGLETVYERDRRLAKYAFDRPRFADLLVYGFGPEQMEQLNLIHAGVEASVLATLCLCSGKQVREERVWIGEWEKRYKNYEVIDDATTVKPLKALSEAIASSEGKALNALPIEFCGYTHIRQEAKAAVVQSALILEKNSKARVGIVTPVNSVLSREICSELHRLDLPHHDVKGSYEGPDRKQLALLAWAQWQERSSIQHFLKFLSYLKELQLAPYEAVQKIHRAIDDAYMLLGVDDFSVLKMPLSKALSRNMEAMQLIEEWPLLPEQTSLEGFIVAATPVLQKFSLEQKWEEGAEYTLPLQRTLSGGVSRSHFVHWFRERLRTPGRTRQLLGRAVFSNVQVVDYESAEYFDFTHAIFTGLNQEGWPGEKSENLFLTHKRIRFLNEPYNMAGDIGTGYHESDTSYIVGNEQQRVLAESSWGRLVEQVSQKAIFSLTLDPASESEGMKVPGDFFLKTWLAVKGSLPGEDTLHLLAKQGKAYVKQMVSFVESEWVEKEHCCTVWRNRRNPNLPYGPYEFSFEIAPEGGLKFSAKDWEEVCKRPVGLWFKKVIHAPKSDNYKELQSKSLVCGTRLHNWLQLKHPNSLLPMDQAGSWLQNLEGHAIEYCEKAKEAFNAAGRELPDWWLREWEEVLKKARKVAQQLEQQEDWERVGSEYKIPEGIYVSLDNVEGNLLVYGRSDCIFAANGGKRIWVVDFKTGNAKVHKKSGVNSKGDGFQLLLYALALKEFFKSAEVTMSIMKPDDALSSFTLPDQFDESVEAFWEELMKVHHTGVLGMKLPMRDKYLATEELPMATILIDKEILKAKWELTHPYISSK